MITSESCYVSQRRIMKDLNAINFKTFIVALSFLKKEFPKAKQAELNQIGREIALGYADFDKLDDFAENYKPLEKIYQQLHTLMTNSHVEINQEYFPIINEVSQEKATEITNIVKAARELVDEEKLEDWFLVLQDINSVQAAKNKIKVLPIVL